MAAPTERREGRRFALDPWARRSAAGRLLVGGSPARMIRLSAAGARTLDALLGGRPAGAGGGLLLARLLEAGIVHPVPGPGSARQQLTVVVPVRNGGRQLTALVTALGGFGPVIVVDDGSDDGSPELARGAGAQVVPNRGAPGPAGARNTGLALAETELVCFIDADCRSATNWAPRLSALLIEEPELALIAPRVKAAPGDGAVARYESGASPLDMGDAPSLVGPGRRVGFLPSAALVCRRSALLAVGGFDESRRVGEDVDLELRLLAAGWRLRYAPAETVEHRSRANLGAMMRQRLDYGRSAAALDRAHPGAVAPLRTNRHSLALWLGLAAGPWTAAAAALGAGAAAALRGADPDERRALAALAARSQAIALPHLARALVRDWAPLTLIAAIASPRARRLAALAAAADIACARRAGAAPQPVPRFAALRLADNLSYATGLWLGALRMRSARALLPAGSGRTSPGRAASPAGAPRRPVTRPDRPR